jgi:hypothetical protein
MRLFSDVFINKFKEVEELLNLFVPLKQCSGENLHQKPLNFINSYSATVVSNGQEKALILWFVDCDIVDLQ